MIKVSVTRKNLEDGVETFSHGDSLNTGVTEPQDQRARDCDAGVGGVDAHVSVIMDEIRAVRRQWRERARHQAPDGADLTRQNGLPR